MNQPEVIRLNLLANSAYFTAIAAALERMTGVPESVVADVQAAFASVVSHALADGRDQADRKHSIEVRLMLTDQPRRLTVELADKGDKQRPLHPKDTWRRSFDLPDAVEPGQGELRRQDSRLGMGVFLIRQLMDEVTYHPQVGNNHWRLVKNLRPPSVPPNSGGEETGEEVVRLDLPATHRYLNVLGACVVQMLAQVEGLDEPEELSYSVQLAVQEACANIVDHAYAGEAGRIEIVLTLVHGPRRLVIELHDTGRHTFDLFSVPDPFGAPQLPARGLLTGGALFFISATIVNAGNYLFNLILGRWLGPAAFADFSLAVTLFLVVSFVAAGFQQTAAKFAAAHTAAGELPRLAGTRRWLGRWAWALGAAMLALFALGSPLWMRFFHTRSVWPFVILGIGVPLYLAQGVDRGVLQGQMRFGPLALSYQAEMWVRLIVALALVALGWSVNGAVGGLTASFAATWLVARRAGSGLPRDVALSTSEWRSVAMFAGSVAVAELGQILINNSDVLVVKHFFTSELAGQYAALAMVGRIVFFATRSVVAAMFPIVAQKQEKGEPHRHLLALSLGMVAAVAAVIIAATAIAPELIVKVLFGEAYAFIAPLLWLYAVATALYALANVVVNYRLSLGSGGASVLSVLAGAAQVVGLWVFHDSLRQVVIVQVCLMAALLIALIVWDAWLIRQQKRPATTILA